MGGWYILNCGRIRGYLGKFHMSKYRRKVCLTIGHSEGNERWLTGGVIKEDMTELGRRVIDMKRSACGAAGENGEESETRGQRDKHEKAGRHETWEYFPENVETKGVAGGVGMKGSHHVRKRETFVFDVEGENYG
eukprot:755178-Hanusia_phi.AAC.6